MTTHYETFSTKEQDVCQAFEESLRAKIATVDSPTTNPGFLSEHCTSLRNYLLQRRHLSQAYIPWVNTALCGLNHSRDTRGKEILRELIQDETPEGLPTHAEDLVADLTTLGIPLETILGTLTHPDTEETVRKQHTLIQYSPQTSFNNLRILVAVRTAGELLPGAEYGIITPLLEKLGLKKSRFYKPHWFHDRKTEGTNQQGMTHTELFSSLLKELICSEKTLDTALTTLQNAAAQRTEFINVTFARYDIKLEKI